MRSVLLWHDIQLYEYCVRLTPTAMPGLLCQVAIITVVHDIDTIMTKLQVFLTVVLCAVLLTMS